MKNSAKNAIAYAVTTGVLLFWSVSARATPQDFCFKPMNGAATPLIHLDAARIQQGMSLRVGYAMPQNKVSQKNWIGVFPSSTKHPNSGEYNKLKISAYASGINGVVTLPTHMLPPGTYKLWLLSNDSYTTTLTYPSSFEVVSKTPADPPSSGGASITAVSSTVTAGSTVAINYSVLSSQVNGKNWIAVFPSSTTKPSTPEFQKLSVYAYAPSKSGQVSLDTKRLAAGSYKVWLLAKDGYTVLNGPITITVAAATTTPPTNPPGSSGATFSVVSSTVTAGSTTAINYSVLSSQVDSKNWLAVFPQGTTTPNSSEYQKLRIYAYAPSQSGQINLDTRRLTAGSYKVWLLAKDGYTVLSGPLTITVTR